MTMTRQAQARAELVRAQTAMAERLRIARELHDIVAHSIGVIAIQAGSGRSVGDASPAEGREALGPAPGLARTGAWSGSTSRTGICRSR